MNRNNCDLNDWEIMAEPTEHVTTTEARAGTRNPVNRVVLLVSMVLIVAIFAAILLVAA